MTKERVKVLEQLGFCWEHKSTVWHKRYAELKMFIKEHGHTLVPNNYTNRKLASWVKSQRRQMRLLKKGSPNTLNDERVTLLNAVQFAWKGSASDIPDAAANVGEHHGSSSGEDDEEDDDDDDDDAKAPSRLPVIGEEERKIWAKYKKTTSVPAIGEEEMKIRAKYKKDTTVTVIGEEEMKIWAKYKGK
jgi:hypothetical protein